MQKICRVSESIGKKIRFVSFHKKSLETLKNEKLVNYSNLLIAIWSVTARYGLVSWQSQHTFIMSLLNPKKILLFLRNVQDILLKVNVSLMELEWDPNWVQPWSSLQLRLATTWFNIGNISQFASRCFSTQMTHELRPELTWPQPKRRFTRVFCRRIIFRCKWSCRWFPPNASTGNEILNRNKNLKKK